MPEPKAYDSTKERKKERYRKKEILPPTEVLWEPLLLASYLQTAPTLTSPTFVFPKALRTASVYLSFESKSLTDVLLGLSRA